MGIKDYVKAASEFSAYAKPKEGESQEEAQERFNNVIRNYPALGIIGEAGEVADKIKKIIRDTDLDVLFPMDWDADHKRSLAHELGDVCWYAAEISRSYTIDLRRATIALSGHYRVNFDAEHPTIMHKAVFLSLMATRTALAIISNEDVRDDIRYNLGLIIFTIETIAESIGYKLNDIFDMNIEKLTSRKQRNKISGSGDNR